MWSRRRTILTRCRYLRSTSRAEIRAVPRGFSSGPAELRQRTQSSLEVFALSNFPLQESSFRLRTLAFERLPETGCRFLAAAQPEQQVTTRGRHQIIIAPSGMIR